MAPISAPRPATVPSPSVRGKLHRQPAKHATPSPGASSWDTPPSDDSHAPPKLKRRFPIRGVCVNDFAIWLSTTAPSLFIQRHEVWMIPVIQSLHIIGIGLAVGAALMMILRVLGWAATDQAVLAVQARFGPWLTGALCLLLASGGLLVVAEPVRELVTFSFWLKM